MHGLDTKKPRQPIRGPLLSSRLRMVAQLLPGGRRLIDIGTDHAYLPIHAILGGRYAAAIAADVRAGPLESACRNIERFGCTACIRTEQSDGLQNFQLENGDVVVMAGLGGLEMIDILREAPFYWPSLVLQPQKSAPELRRHLAQSGYVIRQESLCLDGTRIYLGIRADYSPAESVTASVDPIDFFVGPTLRREQPPLFESYLLKQRMHVTRAMLRQPLLASVQQSIDQLLMTIAASRSVDSGSVRLPDAADDSQR